MGLLDADIYGPSIPLMMNLSGQPELTKRTCGTLVDVSCSNSTSLPLNSRSLSFISLHSFFIEDKMVPLVNYGVKW